MHSTIRISETLLQNPKNAFPSCMSQENWGIAPGEMLFIEKNDLPIKYIHSNCNLYVSMIFDLKFSFAGN